MQCPQCKHDNPAGQKFCGECGAPLAASCSACGAPNPPGQKFCGACGAPLVATAAPSFGSPDSYTPRHLAEKILTSRAALEGERKQVTVLFADLKGSMELLVDRDPEEARKLLDPVLTHMMEAVHRYEGTVNQVMGDGIMALFGAPLSHEDHAVRACYAALRMQETVRQYAERVRRSEGVRVQIRVGLNSGEVVVRSIGSDLHMDYTAVGQTTHLAARMEQVADPGSIFITAATLHLVEGFVTVKPLGPVAVKGMSAPVEVYEVAGAGEVRTRLQAAAACGLTRFVGRDEEMDVLTRAQEEARDGRGQLVAVVGEAGVGKSRLYHEFIHSHRTTGWSVLEGASVSYGKATSYLPVLELLRTYFEIHDGDKHRQIREKVTGKLLTLDRALEPSLPALLALLDVPVDDGQWQALDPSRRRQRTLETLTQLVLREAHVQPLVLVFEDLHWIDSETEALLDNLIERLPTARVLLLVNYRPEYRHGWGGKTYYRQLRVDPLPRQSAEELLQALVGSDLEIAPLTRRLIEHTGGNPFFLEESVRTLVETGALAGDRGSYRVLKSLERIQVPATVQAILAARIDRLIPEEKALLQSAAVVGKDVPFVLLKAIVNDDDHALRAKLARLQGAEFLYETALFPDPEYTFKHALTHEVAYASLLEDRRRTLHARLVNAIEQVWFDRLPEQLERLSEHAVRGAVWDKALSYLKQAGAKAYGFSALREAVGSWEKALVCLGHLPASREMAVTSIELRMQLRNSLMQLGELPRVGEHLREAQRLADELDDQPRLAQITSILSNYFLNAGDTDRAVASAQRALGIVTELGDPRLQVMVNLHLGYTQLALGDYHAAHERLGRNVSAISPAQYDDPFGLAIPASILSRAVDALALTELGAFDDATRLGQEAVRLADRFDRALDRVYAYRGLAAVYVRRGDIDRAAPLLERGLDLCRMGNFLILLLGFAPGLGYVKALQGRLAEALLLAEESLKSPQCMKSVLHLLPTLWIGDTFLVGGRIEEAREFARRALDLARQQRGRGAEAWALLLLGDVASQPAAFDAESANRHYGGSVAVATDLGMRPLIARCHHALGVLHRRTGNADKMHEHLGIATTMFREMGMHFWLEKAETDGTRTE